MRKFLAPLAGVAVLALAFSLAFAGEDKKAGGAAAAKPGDAAPSFSLQDTSGKTVNLADSAGKITVIEWVNPDCPYVVRHYNLGTMKNLAEKNKDVQWLAIATGPAADGEKLQSWASEKGISYPILLDKDGSVGRAYGAKTTPHMFIVDKGGKLAYAGAIDSDAEGKPEAPLKDGTTNYVEKALTELASGSTVSQAQTKAYGCGVKYPK